MKFELPKSLILRAFPADESTKAVFHFESMRLLSTCLPTVPHGHLRLDYLKKHRRGTYTTLLTTCKLNEHLAEVDAEASQCVRELTEAFARAEGIAEQLKATNNFLWAKEMNNCKARAEEIVLREVVYR